MSALAADRNTSEIAGGMGHYPVAAGVEIFAGSLVVLDGGYACPGKVDTDLVCVGRAEEAMDNSTGQAGDLFVDCKPGCFKWANSAATDAITLADVGKPCYVVDDQTVAKTYGEVEGSGTRSEAGIVLKVDADGVWVKTEL